LEENSSENNIAAIINILKECIKDYENQESGIFITNSISKLDEFNLDKTKERELSEILNQIISLSNEKVKQIKQTKIPTIIYTDRSKIADAFTALNQGGAILSKYEVFAAS